MTQFENNTAQLFSSSKLQETIAQICRIHKDRHATGSFRAMKTALQANGGASTMVTHYYFIQIAHKP